MKRKNMVVGMKVVIKASEDQKEYGIAVGQEAIITQLEPTDYKGDYVVDVNVAGKTLWFMVDAIKPAEKREKKPLKVGDKVMERVSEQWPPGTELTVAVVDADDPHMPYLVEDSAGQDYWYSRYALRRAKSK